MALGSTQPLTEMSIRNLPGGKWRPALKADNLTAIAVSLPYGPPWPVYRDSFTLTAQKTHYVSAPKPNRLMLFRETVAVNCENHTEHTNTLCGQKTQFVPHRKHITSLLQSLTG
jgi:hypothetical protein